MQQQPKRPCRCKERAEAMKRASIALLTADLETWQREMDFVRTTFVEDFGKN